MKYIIPQQTILLLILFVGCKGVDITEEDIHPIVGEWIGIERGQKFINSDGETLSTDISSYNKTWNFYQDNTFLGGDITSYSGVSFSVKWSINENELILTIVVGEENMTLLYDYSISNNILSLIRIIHYDNGDSLIIKLIFNKSN